MDEIDIDDNFTDYSGEGTLDLDLSHSSEELAHGILEELQKLKEQYAIEEDGLKLLVELLKEVFTIVEDVPVLQEVRERLQDERDILEEQWKAEKEKYKKRTEVCL